MAGAATRNRSETRERVVVQPIAVHSIEVRARYPECDPMGVVHHSVYPVWFEMGRTEMLRAAGGSYRDLEAAGVFLAVVHLEVRYRRPARYDDVLRLETSLMSPGPVKIEHAYRLFRGDELLVEGRTTLACLDRAGRAQPVPHTCLAPTAAEPGGTMAP